ncbi:TPA: hypothetical protein ACPYU1_001159, partial [Raoultella planticola]
MKYGEVAATAGFYVAGTARFFAVVPCFETQKAHPRGWASYWSDAWQFMAGVLPLPPGRCSATFTSAPGGFVLLRSALTDKRQTK